MFLIKFISALKNKQFIRKSMLSIGKTILFKILI